MKRSNRVTALALGLGLGLGTLIGCGGGTTTPPATAKVGLKEIRVILGGNCETTPACHKGSTATATNKYSALPAADQAAIDFLKNTDTVSGGKLVTAMTTYPKGGKHSGTPLSSADEKKFLDWVAAGTPIATPAAAADDEPLPTE